MFFNTSDQNTTKFGYLNRHNVRALTCGPLVYVRNLKCASTFFYESFQRCWKWDEINWIEIDWANQHVFGHIMDPVARRHKAVAEFIDMNNLNSLFHSNLDFREFVKYAGVFDQHSATYHDTFGNFVYHIDWIPCDLGTHQDTIAYTEKLLNMYGLRTLKNWDYGRVHASDADKKLVELGLKELWASENPPPDWVNLHTHRDRMLYDRVINRFNATGEIWTEMSWLRV